MGSNPSKPSMEIIYKVHTPSRQFDAPYKFFKKYDLALEYANIQAKLYADGLWLNKKVEALLLIKEYKLHDSMEDVTKEENDMIIESALAKLSKVEKVLLGIEEVKEEEN